MILYFFLRYAAGSQFITHFTGRMLDRLKLQGMLLNISVYIQSMFSVKVSLHWLCTTTTHRLKLQDTPINTKGYDTLLKLTENTCKDRWEEAEEETTGGNIKFLNSVVRVLIGCLDVLIGCLGASSYLSCACCQILACAAVGVLQWVCCSVGAEA